MIYYKVMTFIAFGFTSIHLDDMFLDGWVRRVYRDVHIILQLRPLASSNLRRPILISFDGVGVFVVAVRIAASAQGRRVVFTDQRSPHNNLLPLNFLNSRCWLFLGWGRYKHRFYFAVYLFSRVWSLTIWSYKISHRGREYNCLCTHLIVVLISSILGVLLMMLIVRNIIVVLVVR